MPSNWKISVTDTVNMKITDTVNMKVGVFCDYMYYHYYWLPFKIYVRFFLLESRIEIIHGSHSLYNIGNIIFV